MTQQTYRSPQRQHDVWLVSIDKYVWKCSNHANPYEIHCEQFILQFQEHFLTFHCIFFSEESCPNTDSVSSHWDISTSYNWVCDYGGKKKTAKTSVTTMVIQRVMQLQNSQILWRDFTITMSVIFWVFIVITFWGIDVDVAGNDFFFSFKLSITG